MARPKLGDSDTERLHLKIPRDELDHIEDWRYANRIPSKSEAVRRLCQLGLSADENIEKARDTINISRQWIAAALDVYYRETDHFVEDGLALDAPEVVQDLAIAFGAISLGLTLLQRTAFDKQVLREVADIEQSTVLAKTETPFQKLKDDLDRDFLERFDKLIKHRDGAG